MNVRGMMLLGLALATAVSPAAGATWVDRGALEGPSPAGLDAAVAANVRGDALAVWARNTSDPAVLAAVRRVGSDTFGPAVRLTPPCANRCFMWSVTAAINADGDLLAGWMHREGALFSETTAIEGASGNAAGGWGATAVVAGPVAGFTTDVTGGIDAAGRSTLVWSDPADRYVMTSSRPPAGAWSAAGRLSAAPLAWDPVLAVAPGGDATAAWEGGDCRLWTARAQAGTWGAPVAVGAADECGRAPQVVDDGAGPATLVWRRWNGRGWTVRSADATGPASWSAVDVEPTGGVGLLQSRRAGLAPVARGGRILAWAPGANTLRITRRGPGGAWSTAETVPLANPEGNEPAVAALDDGAPLVVTRGLAARSRSVRGGAAWTTPVIAGDAGEQIAGPVPLPGGGALVLRRGDAGLRVAEYTDANGPAIALRRPAIQRATAPASAPRGATVTIALVITGTIENGTAEIQERRGTAWRAVGRTPFESRPPGGGTGGASVRFRVPRAGPVTVRVRLVDADGPPLVSAPVTIRGTVPGLRRIPVPAGTVRLAAGGGAVWALSGTETASTVTRLDPVTGRPGRALSVAGAPVDLAGDATALWVLTRPNGFTDARLTRIEIASGAVAAATIAGGAFSVAADGRHVWVGGVCPPTPRPYFVICGSAQEANAVDRVTGRPTGTVARSIGSVANVKLVGGALWGWGFADDLDNSVLTRFDPMTGATTSGPFHYSGRYGVPLQPMGADIVWAPWPGALSQVRPVTRRLASPSGVWRIGGVARDAIGWRVGGVASDGPRAWVLERRGFNSPGRQERLVPLTVQSGRRAGAAVALGWTANAEQSSVLIAGGTAWVLRPAEDALLRIPLRR